MRKSRKGGVFYDWLKHRRLALRRRQGDLPRNASQRAAKNKITKDGFLLPYKSSITERKMARRVNVSNGDFERDCRKALELRKAKNKLSKKELKDEVNNL